MEAAVWTGDQRPRVDIWQTTRGFPGQPLQQQGPVVRIFSTAGTPSAVSTGRTDEPSPWIGGPVGAQLALVDVIRSHPTGRVIPSGKCRAFAMWTVTTCTKKSYRPKT